MKKQKLTRLLLITGLLGTTMWVKADSVLAHGYVETPPARGYQGKLDSEKIGWGDAFQLYGSVITNPQSLEAPKGFPIQGPADGRIASANGGLGQINDFVLDKQTSTRWKKTDINTGPVTFTWKYTAPHKTSKWHYYMTKTGWNQNAPLSRDELQLIGEVNHDGTTSSNNLSHTINIPKDRSGYHVILAVWDVADTPNAFYNVIDVNVNNSTLPEFPTKPTNLNSSNISKNSISLSWDSQTTAEKYNVYRDGVKIKTVDSNQYEDKNLKAGTEYRYEVEASSTNGKLSEKSDAIKVRTLTNDTQEKPTVPTGLHAMNITSSSATLMWNASHQTSGIKKYEIYRDGVLVGNTKETSYTDKELLTMTQYKYHIKAISNDGNISDSSNSITLTTKNDDNSPGEYREFKVGTFSKPENYSKDEIVTYEGQNYVCLVTHSNQGQTSWNPKDAQSLFKLKTK